jgi:hypothetical protein
MKPRRKSPGSDVLANLPRPGSSHSEAPPRDGPLNGLRGPSIARSVGSSGTVGGV